MSLKHYNQNLQSILYTSLSIFLFWSCGSSTDTSEQAGAESNSEVQNIPSITISGTMNGGANSTIFLYHFGGEVPLALDSVVVDENSNFSLSRSHSGYQFFGFGATPDQLALMLLKGGEAVSLNGNKEDWVRNFTVSGSSETDSLTKYTNTRRSFVEKIQAIQAEMGQLPYDEKNTEAQLKLEQLGAEFDTFKYTFIQNNINSPVVYAAFPDLYNLEKDLPLIKQMETTMNKFMPGSNFATSVSNKIAQAEQMSQQNASMADQQNAQLEILAQAGIEVGKEAPSLNFPDPTGKNVSLESLKGKVVLLDFWASWCKPCRMENPNVVKLYNAYQAKGFSIYSVSLDNNKEKWEAAIAQDGLLWPNHVSDLKGWQSAAGAAYMVNSIPQTFLIGADGKIIAIGLRGVELENKLKELLG